MSGKWGFMWLDKIWKFMEIIKLLQTFKILI